MNPGEERSAASMLWVVRLTCCGHDEGVYTRASTWEEADAFREAYTSGAGVHPNGYSAPEHSPGHKRSAVIEAVTA